MNKVLRLFLFLSLLCIAIFSFSGCIGIWYEFFDVTGLEFYEGQNIKEIYPYGNQ